MEAFNRELVINKITEMSKEQVSKVLIFMAGMEAEHIIWQQSEAERNKSRNRLHK